MPKVLGSHELVFQLNPFYRRFAIYFISLNFDKSFPIVLENSTCRGYFPDIALIPTQPEKREKVSSAEPSPLDIDRNQWKATLIFNFVYQDYHHVIKFSKHQQTTRDGLCVQNLP